MRKSPPTSRIRSRPEKPCPATANSGAVSRMIQVMESSSRMRVTNAPPSPSERARGCSVAGSFPARMEMKMTLSMPRTISSTVRVRSAIHASGEASQSRVMP